jgi:acyl carrier protein
MSMELNKEIYKLIEEALGLNAGLINFESDNKNISEWDSLGHFAILSALDNKYDDITIRSPRLVEATSVVEIVDIVTNDKN